MTKYTNQPPVGLQSSPGDVFPLSGPPEPAVDALARVYALILSWPLPEEDETALNLKEESE